VGDDVFFERDQGFLEPGTVLELLREPAALGGRVLAVVQYKDKTWAKYAGYNQRKSVEELQLPDQLVSRSRTRRPPRPITRYQPPAVEPATGKGKGKGGGGGGYKTALPRQVDEEKERRKREREKRKRRKLRRERREAARKRRETRARRRALGRRFLGMDGDGDGDGDGALGEEEMAELVALLGVEDTGAVRAALEELVAAEGDAALDDAMDVTSSDGDGSVSSSSLSSSSAASSSSGESSCFPEADSPSEAEPAEERDVGLSDVSTDSCPSEPEYLYWPRLANPGASERKAAGLQRFLLCPKADSDDSEASGACVRWVALGWDGVEGSGVGWSGCWGKGKGKGNEGGRVWLMVLGAAGRCVLTHFFLPFPLSSLQPSNAPPSATDEEQQEMGLTATVVAWTPEERKELLREYLARPTSASRRARTGALSYKEWCLALHIISEDSGGIGHLESCQAIKGVKRCEGMRTMYGAIRAPLIQEMIRVAKITPQDRFIDIGSGLGTVVLQTAAVAGCCRATVRVRVRLRLRLIRSGGRGGACVSLPLCLGLPCSFSCPFQCSPVPSPHPHPHPHSHYLHRTGHRAGGVALHAVGHAA
jgi:hypothetical protein